MDIEGKKPGVGEFEYWKRMVAKHPKYGDFVQHDVNSPFDELHHQNTVLHLALLGFYSISEVTELVSLLLENGADPNIQNDKGETSLHFVCQHTMRAPEIARVLLEHGADPTIRTKIGKLPVDFLSDDNDRYSREIRALLGEYKSE